MYKKILEEQFDSLSGLNKFVSKYGILPDVINIQRFVNSNLDIKYLLFYKSRVADNQE